MKFSEKTVMNVSGATLLGVAVFLFGLVSFPSVVDASLSATTTIGIYEVGENCNIDITMPFDGTDTMSAQTADFRLYKGTRDNYSTQLAGITGYSAVNYGTFFSVMGFGMTGNSLFSSSVDSTIDGQGEGAGEYVIYISVDSTETAYEFTYNGLNDCEGYGVVPSFSDQVGFFSETNTRFTDLDITGTSTVNFLAEYYLDLNEVDNNISELNPTEVKFEYSLRPSTDLTGYGETIDNSVSGTSTVDVDISGFSDGTYDLRVSFSNAGCTLGLSACPFVSTYIYSEFTIASGTLSSVGENELYDAQSFAEIEKYLDCSITRIDNCLKNVVIWMFVPPEFSVNYYENTIDYLWTRVIFVHVYQFGTVMNAIRDGATEGTFPTVTIDVPALGEMTIMDADEFDNGSPLDVGSTILRSASVGIIWIVTGWWFFYRLRKFVLNLNQAQLE